MMRDFHGVRMAGCSNRGVMTGSPDLQCGWAVDYRRSAFLMCAAERRILLIWSFGDAVTLGLSGFVPPLLKVCHGSATVMSAE